MAQRIGILGGTFNPVHYGHLAAAEEVRERLHLDRVLFVPSFLPPHKEDKDLPSAAQRAEMVRLAIAGNASFAVSGIEVDRGGRSYTIDTIAALGQQFPDAALFFITGLDSFLEIRTWKRWQELMTLCAFVILSRPGFRFSDLLGIDFLKNSEKQLLALDREEVRDVLLQPGKFNLYMEKISHYDISSTDIRKRVREGRAIKYLLPEAVEHYIIKNELYA